MNFAVLMKLKDSLSAFQARHPKFPLFLNAVRAQALTEGTIIDIQVIMPDGKTLNSNLKLTKEDIEFLHQLGELQ
ncbi:MAG: hypothetical protein ACLTKI_00800 [Lachnospiraceae bacterium]